jgi:hypothetical protein
MKYIEIEFTGAIIALFLIFWMQSGWYRIDCALGEPKACELIHAEYVAKAKP